MLVSSPSLITGSSAITGVPVITGRGRGDADVSAGRMVSVHICGNGLVILKPTVSESRQL